MTFILYTTYIYMCVCVRARARVCVYLYFYVHTYIHTYIFYTYSMHIRVYITLCLYREIYIDTWFYLELKSHRIYLLCNTITTQRDRIKKRPWLWINWGNICYTLLDLKLSLNCKSKLWSGSWKRSLFHNIIKIFTTIHYFV